MPDVVAGRAVHALGRAPSCRGRCCPPPTTSATSTPRPVRPPTISRAIVSTRRGVERRTRRRPSAPRPRASAGRAGTARRAARRGRRRFLRLASSSRRARAARTRATSAPASASAFPTVLRRVVDPGLLLEHRRGEEALVEHPLDDLLTRLLRLRLHLVGARGRCRARRRRAPRGTSSRVDVARRAKPRCASRACGRARGEPPRECDEHAELVRGRVHVAVDRPGRRRARSAPATTTWMFSPSFADELLALVLELLDSAPTPCSSTLAAPSSRTRGTPRSSRRARSRSRRRRSCRAAVVGRGSRPALGRLAAGALGGGRHALLAQELERGLEVAARLLQRALAVHHPGAGLVAELLHERWPRSSVTSSPLVGARGSSARRGLARRRSSGASVSSAAAGLRCGLRLRARRPLGGELLLGDAWLARRDARRRSRA